MVQFEDFFLKKHLLCDKAQVQQSYESVALSINNNNNNNFMDPYTQTEIKLACAKNRFGGKMPDFSGTFYISRSFQLLFV